MTLEILPLLLSVSEIIASIVISEPVFVSIRQKIGKDPVTNGIKEALLKAYGATQEKYSYVTDNLFDPLFLEKFGAPIIARILTRTQKPSGLELAKSWANSIGIKNQTAAENIASELILASSYFLEQFEIEAKKQDALQQIFNNISFETTAEASINIAENTFQIVQKLKSLEHHLITYKDKEQFPRQIKSPYRSSLPRNKTKRLVGRDETIEKLENYLINDDSKLIALYGIGGIGKTEIALNISVSPNIQSAFTGGVIWIDCGENNLQSLQDHISIALGWELDPQADLTIRKRFLDSILTEEPPLLIVLDDIRSFHINDLQLICPLDSKHGVLVTSRREDFPIEFINEPINALNTIKSTEIIELYIGKHLTEDCLYLINSIITLTEGIPLALHLVSRRAKNLLNNLDSNLKNVLTTIILDLQNHQKHILHQGNRRDLSVYVSLDLTYNSLGFDLQLLLCGLSTFVSCSFNLKEVNCIWKLQDQISLDHLRLLELDGLIEEAGEKVWWMHSIVQEYLQDKINNHPNELYNFSFQHALYFLDLIYYVQQNETHRDSEAFYNLLPEAIQGMRWSVKNWEDFPGFVVAYTQALYKIVRWGYIPEGENLLRVSVDSAEKIGDKRLIALQKIDLSVYLEDISEYDEAERISLEVLSILEELKEDYRIALVHVNLGDINKIKGNYNLARKHYFKAIDLFKLLEMPVEVANTRLSLAQILRREGRIKQAENECRIAIKELSGFEDSKFRIVEAQRLLGSITRILRKFNEAEELLTHVLEVAYETDSPKNIAAALHSLGTLRLEQKRYEEAEKLYTESLRIKIFMKSRREICVTQTALASVYKQKERILEAESLWLESISELKFIGDLYALAISIYDLAELYEENPNVFSYNNYQKLIIEGLEVSRQINNPKLLLKYLLALAQIKEKNSNLNDAISILEEAYSIAYITQDKFYLKWIIYMQLDFRERRNQQNKENVTQPQKSIKLKRKK